MKTYKKTKGKQLFILSAILLITVGVCLAMIGIIKSNGKKVTASAATENPIGLSLIMSEGSGYISPMKGGAAEVSKSITATVLPESATDKEVDWEAVWGGAQSGDVSEYMTITPESDGSTHATVTCKGPFDGEIIIVCTTRKGGHTASCIATFTGCPTEIDFTGYVPDAGDKSLYGVGEDHEYDVTLSNPFGQVGSKFNNYVVSVTGVGKIEVGYTEHYNRTGTDVWYEDTLKAVDIDTLKDDFITASYSGGKLRITVLRDIQGYYLSSQRIDSGRTIAYTDKFHAYISECYFAITVTETTSGVSKTINVLIDPTAVTGVSLSEETLEF